MSVPNEEFKLRGEFHPRENFMTVLFPSESSARAAAGVLRERGIDLTAAEMAVHRQAGRAGQHRGERSENEVDEAGDEVARVASESFSDDEKILAQVRRALGAGAAALSFPIGDQEERREELARHMKEHGALAVYFFGAWTTEWL
jgi:hypothetical protein